MERGGIVVSRKQLEVNFARNEVIKSACPVWKGIRAVISAHVAKMSDSKKEKKTNSWREHKVQQMVSWDGEVVMGGDLFSAPCFTDISGKHWSLERLSNKPVITLGLRDSLPADRLHASGQALVLNRAILDQYCRPLTFAELLHQLKDRGSLGCSNYGAVLAKNVLKSLVDFDTLAATITSDHHALTEKELSKPQVTTLRAINRIQYLVALRMSSVLATGERVRPRRVGAMKSETAEAITDGRTAIYLRTDFLSSLQHGPALGISWAVKVVNLLVHEYLHDFNSGVGHTHDAEFYELYHEATQSQMVIHLASELFREYVSGLKKLPAAAARALDSLAVIEDRLGAAPVPPDTPTLSSDDEPQPDGSPFPGPATPDEALIQNALLFTEG